MIQAGVPFYRPLKATTNGVTVIAGESILLSTIYVNGESVDVGDWTLESEEAGNDGHYILTIIPPTTLNIGDECIIAVYASYQLTLYAFTLPVEIVGSAVGPIEQVPIAESNVWKLTKRHDGITRAANSIVMEPGEKAWVAFEAEQKLPTGVYLQSVGVPISSTPAELVVSASDRGVLGTQAKLYLDATDAVAGSDYTITAVLVPRSGEAIVARGIVRCRSES